MHNESTNVREEKETTQIFKEMMSENFSNLWKNNKLHIQKAQ